MNDRTRVPVTLETPIKRGDAELSEITLRKPQSGELRGLTLQALGQSDVTALLTLIPRISEPPLAEHEVAELEVEDLAAMGNVVFDFFLKPDQRAKIREMLGR